jgi:uncharacterized membrane protein YtjA (UPF0391 family)
MRRLIRRGDVEPDRVHAGYYVKSANSLATYRTQTSEITPMPGNLIYYALVLIVVALIAALFGFGGVASTAMGGAHLLIWVAVIVVIVGVVFAVMRRA